MDSSKIKKNISAIYFDGDRTKIHFSQNFTPSGGKEAITETPIFKSDLGRHPDFERAMERMKVHMMLRSFGHLIKPDDRTGKKLIDKDWFDEYGYEDDPRFSEAEVKGVIITTKKDESGFYIQGHTLSMDDLPVKVKSPVISLLKVEGGYKYPLFDLAKEHLEVLLLEAEEFLKYKSNNPQLKLAV